MVATKDNGEEEKTCKGTAKHKAKNDSGSKSSHPEKPEANKAAEKKQRSADGNHQWTVIGQPFFL